MRGKGKPFSALVEGEGVVPALGIELENLCAILQFHISEGTSAGCSSLGVKATRDLDYSIS